MTHYICLHWAPASSFFPSLIENFQNSGFSKSPTTFPLPTPNSICSPFYLTKRKQSHLLRLEHQHCSSGLRAITIEMASQSEPNGSFIHRIGLDLYNLLESLGLILEQKKSAITEFFSSCTGNINNLAGRGYKLTISAFASIARKPSPSPPVPVTHENGIYTLVFSQGCGPFSTDCILKEFDTVEELQEITAIAAGPRPFGSTSVNTTVWRTPIQYYFNPSYDYNYA